MPVPPVVRISPQPCAPNARIASWMRGDVVGHDGLRRDGPAVLRRLAAQGRAAEVLVLAGGGAVRNGDDADEDRG